MPFIPAPGILRVEMFYDLNGEVMENVYHVIDGSATPIVPDDVADIFIDWETNSASASRSNGVRFTQVRVTDLSSPSGVQVTKAPPAPVVGGRPNAVMPGNVTWAVKANTTRGGRGTQGRTFWIGLDEGDVTDNNINQDMANQIVNSLNDLVQSINVDFGDAFLAVLHSQANHVLLNPRTATPISTWTYRDRVLDSQKSRLPGKRRHKRTP